MTEPMGRFTAANAIGRGLDEGLARRTESLGVVGALVLGVLFALSFCPISAALFFGSLLPLSLEAGSRVLLPAAYGVGTALPVLGVALLLVFGVNRAASWLRRLQQVAKHARTATGVVLVGVGVVQSLTHVFHVL